MKYKSCNINIRLKCSMKDVRTRAHVTDDVEEFGLETLEIVEVLGGEEILFPGFRGDGLELVADVQPHGDGVDVDALLLGLHGALHRHHGVVGGTCTRRQVKTTDLTLNLTEV